jgi:hypothetical protein
MPRYYLHICNGSGSVEDEEGAELPNLEAARVKAVEGLRDIMASEMKRGEINLGSFIEIEDENRQLVMTVPFTDAVSVTNRTGSRPH